MNDLLYLESLVEKKKFFLSSPEVEKNIKSINVSKSPDGNMITVLVGLNEPIIGEYGYENSQLMFYMNQTPYNCGSMIVNNIDALFKVPYVDLISRNIASLFGDNVLLASCSEPVGKAFEALGTGWKIGLSIKTNRTAPYDKVMTYLTNGISPKDMAKKGH